MLKHTMEISLVNSINEHDSVHLIAKQLLNNTLLLLMKSGCHHCISNITFKFCQGKTNHTLQAHMPANISKEKKCIKISFEEILKLY